MMRLAVDADGERLVVHAWGTDDDDPLIALHGFGVTGARTFRYVAPGFAAAAVRLLAPELPGLGAADAPGTACGLRRYADLVAALADELGLDRPALLGHSLGGKIAAAAAALHPERFGRLVLVAPGGFSRLAPLLPFLAGLADAVDLFERRWFTDHVLPRTPLAAVFPDAASRAALRRLRGAHAALDLDRTGLRPRLARITAPTLVVWGADDPVLPVRTARRVLRDIPHAALSVIPGAGHAPMKDRPAALVETVVSFLQ